VVKANEPGRRIERRVSNFSVMAVHGCERLVFITDAAINIEPGIAIRLAVETVAAKMPPILCPAALSKMADRGGSPA